MGHTLLRSDWKNLCNNYYWHHFTVRFHVWMFGVSGGVESSTMSHPQPLHSWSSHCTGLLFAGKLLNLHSWVPTYQNQPQLIVVWSFKGIFFFYWSCQDTLSSPKMWVLVTPSVGKKKSSSCYSRTVNKVWKPFRWLIELTHQLVCSSGRFHFF